MSSIKQKTTQERTAFGNITSSYKHRSVIGTKSGRGDPSSIVDRFSYYKENQSPNIPIQYDANGNIIMPATSPVGSTGSQMWAISESSEDVIMQDVVSQDSVNFNRMNETQIQTWIDTVPNPPS